MGRIVSWQELKGAIKTLKSRGQKIVFTNGCFDIIHVGHVRYLREAKKLGSILVVGLNSDSSVAGLKPGRPINPQDQRAEVLSALEMVDYVVIFEEDTPYSLIKFIEPDLLVKGGDWKREDIVGSDIVPEVMSLPYIDGVSTTEIIKKITTK
ncbi:MAG: D-glycero-beta-D-manno-heptose 1-phosphate adenylyltransferase [Dissulfurispiraceae bacterium]|jgi:D-beta-D-heptose 7-phosphate kinase/D-beta-D-heptose 1-phosphate adenosyltransferase|nr:D-glycero-beta-D-manno-heptose 1-phosphate adenylyltransferase [Dissulfurispiraceae bacterium]